MKKRIEGRFGTVAVEKGFITVNQLVDALAIQARENIEHGKHRPIGQILLDQGLLTEAQINEVLETMSNALIYAISAGR